MLGTFVHVLKSDGFLGLYSGVLYHMHTPRSKIWLTDSVLQLSASLLRQRKIFLVSTFYNLAFKI